MKIRPLIINPEVKAAIAKVIAHAEEHPVSLRAILRTMSQTEPPVGDRPEFVVVVPMGYRCVYSIEEQPIGTCRHLSVSVLGPGTAPNPAAVSVLMMEFGFHGTLEDADSLSHEPFGGGKLAINIVQKIPK